MKNKYVYTVAFCLFLSVYGQAQITPEVHIELPHFAGKPYVFYLMQGDGQDTIQRGVLDKEGKTLLMLSEQRKAFVGMSKFMIVGEGGVEIILNREMDDFLQGLGSRLSLKEKEIQREQQEYILSKVLGVMRDWRREYINK